MDLDECPRCGELFPHSWGRCPNCTSDNHPDVPRMRDDD